MILQSQKIAAVMITLEGSCYADLFSVFCPITLGLGHWVKTSSYDQLSQWREREKLIFKITELFSIMNKQARGASVRYDQKSKEGDKTTHETVSPFSMKKSFVQKKTKRKIFFS